MAERWRKPVVPLAIDEHPSQGILLSDGRVHGDAILTLAPDDLERIRTGFVCAKCLEPFERSWPERCYVCGAPVRREQARYFAHEYGGEERLGPSTTLADERERLKEVAHGN